MKRIRYKEGDLFSIELEDGRKAICKIVLAPKDRHKQAIGCTLIGFQEDINLEKLDLDAHLQLFSNPIVHINSKSKDIFFTGNQNVKNGRKIYVQINAGDYDMVKFPDIKEGTSLRQAENMLRSAGLIVGEKTYKNTSIKM